MCGYRRIGGGRLVDAPVLAIRDGMGGRLDLAHDQQPVVIVVLDHAVMLERPDQAGDLDLLIERQFVLTAGVFGQSRQQDRAVLMIGLQKRST